MRIEENGADSQNQQNSIGLKQDQAVHPGIDSTHAPPYRTKELVAYIDSTIFRGSAIHGVGSDAYIDPTIF